jgi:hypothetical protein
VQTSGVAIYVGPPDKVTSGEGYKDLDKKNKWVSSADDKQAQGCRMLERRFVREYATSAFSPEL